MKKISDASLDRLCKWILKEKYGMRCQLCKKFVPDCGVMHIKSKKAFPELRWELYNLLWAGWKCCHGPSHAGVNVIDKISAVKGLDFTKELYELAQINRVGKLDRERIKTHLEGILKCEKK